MNLLDMIMDDERIQKRFQAQAWEQVKAQLATIQSVSYAPNHRIMEYDEWRKKCEVREKLISEFIAEIQGTELHLI